jgi:hypothetical protein
MSKVIVISSRKKREANCDNTFKCGAWIGSRITTYYGYQRTMIGIAMGWLDVFCAKIIVKI